MIGRIWRRGALPTLVLALVLGGTGGCGEDEESGGGPPVFDVRNGTWVVNQTAWFAGPDSVCDPTSFTSDTTIVLCSFDAGGGKGDLFPFQCEMQQTGSDVTFSCTRGGQLGPCQVTETMQGSGSVQEDRIDLTLWSVVSSVPIDPIYESICTDPATACTLWAEITANWISAEGDSLCNPVSGTAAPAGLETLLFDWRDGILPRDEVSR